MRLKSITTITVLALFLLITTIGILPISAQQSTPTPDLEPRVSGLEKRMYQIEATQTQLVASLSLSNEQYRFLLTAVGAALGAFVVILGIFQGVVTYVQLRREGTRDSRQAQREEERDLVQHSGVKQVSEIMNVVKETLQSRLDAEEQARKEVRETRADLERVLDEIKSLDRFIKSFQSNIQNTRKVIEDRSSQLALVPRHDFRPIVSELNVFAQQFDAFETEYKPLEEEPHRQFSAKALYIRGIAAHYANKPEIAKRYLIEVTRFQQPELGDTEKAYKRRVANAYYYLGIIESNFGKTQDAIDSFENAKSLDPDSVDFLTRLVNAEAYIMKDVDDFGKAEQIIDEIERGLQSKRDKEGRLAGVYLRLRSRATLIRANMAILKNQNTWCQEVQNLIKLVLDDDPNYYYAATTLAQAYHLDNKHDDAQKLFREAYATIERSGDLLMVAEARSQILLRMIAGLCCWHGLMDKTRADEHLDRADGLRGSLPQIDSQVCTVFSALSKRNEKSETIHDHIEWIRKGKVLLEPNG